MNLEVATQCTQNTQGVLDPRRVGRNNSGLSEEDISDVMCILHPCSPAAFKIVADTAERTPHNVLQNDGFGLDDEQLTPSILEEQETFIITNGGPNQAMDLALRFSARARNPSLGFVFGRNENQCDIVMSAELFKRVSNVHFSIFVNHSGVLMLQDLSTNGTVVDDTILKGKAASTPQTRMLNPGSMIQILSPKNDEVVKFIVRFPSREGHLEQYEAKFQAYLENIAAYEASARTNNLINQRLTGANHKAHNSGSIKAPLVQNSVGMHWNGGDRYNVVGQIGKGAFATVYQLATKSEGQLFAAKELEKRRFMKNGILDQKLDNEMKIMQSINHPNIVQYIDYHDHANHVYIIMEFVPCGDLQQYMAHVLHGPLLETLGKKMAAQVLDALAYLHKNHITHRDLKPDNVLIANMDPDDFAVKLSDFGLSKVVKVDDDTFLKTFCGTLLYCAPEVFPAYDSHLASKGKKRTRRGSAHSSAKYHSYSQSVDIWSFGAVLWYSLCHKPPFEGVNDAGGRGQSMFNKIMGTPLDAVDLVARGITGGAISLLAEMLNTDPAARPSAAACLSHEWFGEMRSSVAHAIAGASEGGLGAIAEEEEVEPINEPDFAGLSLDEHESGAESYTSEVSIHSGSLEFLDPRQSKRFKLNASAYREPKNFIGSSPDLSHAYIPIMHQIGANGTPPVQRKLFGEISQTDAIRQTALQSSAFLGRGHDTASQSDNDSAYGTRPRVDKQDLEGAVASPSLLGAESMVRDLNMDSPPSSPASHDADTNEPTTPGVFEQAQTANGSAVLSLHGENEVTPKQPPRPTFNRRIDIPVPPSFWYDPSDPTTHNLAYASKESGRNYIEGVDILEPNESVSLPQTMSGSATENDETEEYVPDAPLAGSRERESSASMSRPPSPFVKPAPRLGKLMSTDDSFTPIALNLSARISSWGRAPSNTHVYPDKTDTRIPKRGIIIWHFAQDIDQIPEEDQAWMKLPDLHCLISTESSQGIYVNGVLLKRSEGGQPSRGRVYSGDEVSIMRPLDSKGAMKFICEFYHGEAKTSRLPGAPRFQLEPIAGQSRSRRKEVGMENVTMPDQTVTAES